jgi:hypothetical protein
MTDERLDVLDVLYRFTTGIDTRDWAMYREAFTDVVDVDYSSYRPGSAGPMPAGDWVARAARLFPGLDASQHTVTNPRVALVGDEAVVDSYVRADHFLGGERYTLGGAYEHRLVRTPDGWRIRAVRLRMTWQEGDRALLERALAGASRG